MMNCIASKKYPAKPILSVSILLQHDWRVCAPIRDRSRNLWIRRQEPSPLSYGGILVTNIYITFQFLLFLILSQTLRKQTYPDIERVSLIKPAVINTTKVFASTFQNCKQIFYQNWCNFNIYVPKLYYRASKNLTM